MRILLGAGDKMGVKARECDSVETFEGIFFNAKGFVHPPGKLIASIKYVPDPAGDRGRGGMRYRKLQTFRDRHSALRRISPQYLVYDPMFGEELCEVPHEDIKYHYKPQDRLRQLLRSSELDEVERDAVALLETLKEASGVPWRKFGLSGSILIGLHSPSSDIDPVVYGSEDCRKVYSALELLLKDEGGPVGRLRKEDCLELFHRMLKDGSKVRFEDLARIETRKMLRGRFGARRFALHLVKDWGEVKGRYGEFRHSRVGYARIRATVEDASEAIFVPCLYKIRDVEVIRGGEFTPVEIISYHWRLCERAREGEDVVAQGKIERVLEPDGNTYHRMVLGVKPSDYMIPMR